MADEKKPRIDRAREQAELIADYQRVFGTEPGKRVLDDLYKRFGFLSTTAVANDSHSTYFNEGQRSVVVWLVNHLKINHQAIVERMMQLNRQDDND